MPEKINVVPGAKRLYVNDIVAIIGYRRECLVATFKITITTAE